MAGTCSVHKENDVSIKNVCWKTSREETDYLFKHYDKLRDVDKVAPLFFMYLLSVHLMTPSVTQTIWRV
jgi:hypothetical protein